MEVTQYVRTILIEIISDNIIFLEVVWISVVYPQSEIHFPYLMLNDTESTVCAPYHNFLGQLGDNLYR